MSRKPLQGRIEMSHGGGGRAMADLIDHLFLEAFDNPWLRQLNDQASLDAPNGRIVMATDAHVISPLFFPGGDIGSLSVHGTVNDVALSGAVPRYLSASFILEEGLSIADLQRIVHSMADAAREAGVAIVTGDTKVVERGKGDGVFITTTGVGVLEADTAWSPSAIRPGDKLILTGTLGDHGITILSLREGLNFDTDLTSDTQSLNHLIQSLSPWFGDIVTMRDPTRGGLSAVLNEWARAAGCGFVIEEQALPIRESVRGACDFLGLDPLHIANEGKAVIACRPEVAEALLAAIKARPEGRDAAIIGEAVADERQFVRMHTAFGGERMVDWLSGEQLPRIC
ncbi:MAG: hydrogenase expression/formation protein HypE [Gammaproteobacteria bacterium]|nr:MAG: hydrogenase expression/formation protein HypE [Gammaproteobacteria bacterium]